MLEILSSSTEFANVPIRQKEENLLENLAKSLPFPLDKARQVGITSTKAMVLLQCHFSRTSLTIDLAKDLEFILSLFPKLITAFVDVVSSNGHLRPAIALMELSQMAIQGYVSLA